MGDPKFSRKKYETPSHPWQKERIDREATLKKKYGLKNRREIWKSETILRGLRSQSRLLMARRGEDQAEKEKKLLLNRVTKLGLLPLESTLDDILALNTEGILSRRLQTLVYLHGLASTTRQARQLVIHGHISVNGRKVRVPSYIVKKGEEESIKYSVLSPLNEEGHPVRPKGDTQSELVEKPPEDERKQPSVQKLEKLSHTKKLEKELDVKQTLEEE